MMSPYYAAAGSNPAISRISCVFVVDVRTMANGYFYDAMLSRCRELADDVTGPIDHALENSVLRFSAFPRACLKFNSIPCAHTRDI